MAPASGWRLKTKLGFFFFFLLFPAAESPLADPPPPPPPPPSSFSGDPAVSKVLARILQLI